MGQVMDYLSGVPSVIRTLTALAGAASVGAATALGVVAYTGLPDGVSDNTRAIEMNQAAIAEIDERQSEATEQLSKIVCLLTEAKDMQPITANTFCEGR